ncbi:flagellar basal body P-ring biosynthesis protein FlgA [bacterium BMS3Bbin07]|nr:flagellar basal body P-ring biosynthesis protein FlgA [bacterium BMS3Bbin07]HDH01517.1 flagellar basal body P-ring formation protein FlgA [Nitrospirota bacterium]
MISLLIALTIVAGWAPEAVIQDYLMNNYPWPEIQVQKLVAEDTLPRSRPVEIITERGPLGRASFLFRFPDNREVRIKAYITARDQVVRTRRALYKGTVIRSTDIYTTMMNVRKIPRGAISDIKGVRGKILKRSLPADSTLTEAVTGEKPLIQKGQRITLLYKTNSLRVTAPGVAREDGYSEREISVMNLTSRKTITGIVESRGIVNVQP